MKQPTNPNPYTYGTVAGAAWDAGFIVGSKATTPAADAVHREKLTTLRLDALAATVAKLKAGQDDLKRDVSNIAHRVRGGRP